jgi:hypothetical protein
MSTISPLAQPAHPVYSAFMTKHRSVVRQLAGELHPAVEEMRQTLEPAVSVRVTQHDTYQVELPRQGKRVVIGKVGRSLHLDAALYDAELGITSILVIGMVKPKTWAAWTEGISAPWRLHTLDHSVEDVRSSEGTKVRPGELITVYQSRIELVMPAEKS